MKALTSDRSDIDEEWRLGITCCLVVSWRDGDDRRDYPLVAWSLGGFCSTGFIYLRLLDCPHTEAGEFVRSGCSAVLMSGHHEEIRRWRLKQSLGRTWLRRPTCWKN